MVAVAETLATNTRLNGQEAHREQKRYTFWLAATTCYDERGKPLVMQGLVRGEQGRPCIVEYVGSIVDIMREVSLERGRLPADLSDQLTQAGLAYGPFFANLGESRWHPKCCPNCTHVTLDLVRIQLGDNGQRTEAPDLQICPRLYGAYNLPDRGPVLKRGCGRVFTPGEMNGRSVEWFSIDVSNGVPPSPVANDRLLLKAR